MSYPFSHVFIPLAILFIFSNKLKLDQKKILYLSFFGLFPDFDAIFFHRMTFHNLFIPMIPFIIFLILKSPTYGLISFYVFSHLVLDLFNGGIAALYPFYKGIFFINAELVASTNSFHIKLLSNYGIRSNFANYINFPKVYYGLISTENFGIAILLLIVGIYYLLIMRKENVK